MACTSRRMHYTPLQKQSDFQNFFTQASCISTEMKSLILKRLNMVESTTIPIFEMRSIEASKMYQEGWETLNRELRKTLSLLKVLLCQQTSLEAESKNVMARNEGRILQCCKAYNQINELCDGFIQNPSKAGVLPTLLNQLGTNLFSYQSSAPEFRTAIEELSADHMPDKKSGHQRKATGNFGFCEEPQQKSNRTEAKTAPRYAVSGRETPNRGPSSPTKHRSSNKKPTPPKLLRQYNKYVQQLHDQIVHLKQQMQDIQRDRDELKQYNILLLETQGILNEQRKHSRQFTPRRDAFPPPEEFFRQTKESQQISIQQKRGQRKARRKGTLPGMANFSVRFNTLA